MFKVFSLLTGDQPCVRFSWKERIESARARTPWTSRGLDIKKKKVDVVGEITFFRRKYYFCVYDFREF